jgi:hypothetical protein
MNDKNAINNNEETNFIDISCKHYEYEYNSCSKLKSRLYQFYENGSKFDCNILKNLLKDCESWKKDMKQESLQNIVNYEKKIMIERKKSVSDNNVWTYREKPPSDWNAKLPLWAEERVKGSSWYTQNEPK